MRKSVITLLKLYSIHFFSLNRNGSIIVDFLLIFVSSELPTQEVIVSTFPISVGIFAIEKSSLTVVEIKVIDAADNPSPSKNSLPHHTMNSMQSCLSCLFSNKTQTLFDYLSIRLIFLR